MKAMKSLKIFLNILLSLLFLSALFFFRPAINDFYHKLRGEVYGDDLNDSLLREIDWLKLENKNLKDRDREDTSNSSYKNGNIYSEYPFNDRRLLVIDLGSKDGIKPGMPVITYDHTLIGKINSVTASESAVQTIFDPAWQSSVAIGEKRVKAVLKGGNSPSLELIPKDSVFSGGETVVNISKELPYNFLLGEIVGMSLVSNEVWQTAKLKMLYDLENLSQVRVVLNFP